MNKIRERLNRHYEEAVKKYGEDAVLGVFLYGSQNYNTDTPESDVDTKCILIPDLYHLACKPYEVKHLDVDGEICECMSVQHMVANWKKQNINFLEILFTPYYKLNLKYYDVWEYLVDEDLDTALAEYDIKKAILSMAHQALHTYKQDPNDFKKQMNMTRICASLHRLTSLLMDYWECISFEEDVAEELRDIRKHGAEPEDIQDRIANLEWYIAHADDYAPDKDYQKHIDEKMDEWILDCIKTRIGYVE